MNRYLLDPFSIPYMQRALVEALLLGAFGGILGVYVLLRRLAFLGDVLTHTIFPGVAAAFVLDVSLSLGALVAGVLSAVVLTVLARSRRVTDDAAMAILLTGFFAVGVALVSRQRSFTADLTALLFGRVLNVDVADIVLTAVVMAVVLAVLAVLHKELVLRSFDEDAARAAGYRVGALDLTLNLLTALFVVASVQAVGTVLAIALVITPAAIARLVTARLPVMFAVSAAVGMLAGWMGLVISYDLSIHHDVRLASGATIVVVLSALFALVIAGRAVVVRLARRRADPGPSTELEPRWAG